MQNEEYQSEQFIVALNIIPTPTPIRTRPRVVVPFDKAPIVAYIESLWGARAQQAIAVFNCESGLNPNAFNPETASKLKGITKFSSYGVAQINAAFDERLYDYKFNLDVAYQMYLNRGWRPWTCARKLGII